MKTPILLAALTVGSLVAGEPAERLDALLQDSREAAAQGDVFAARSLSLQAQAIDPDNIAARVILEKAVDLKAPRPAPAAKLRVIDDLPASGWMHPTLPPKRLSIPDRVNSK